MNEKVETIHAVGRRDLLASSGRLLLSGAAIGVLIGGRKVLAADSPSDQVVQQDIRILNTAMAAEYEAVAAYQLGAESGLLSADVLKVALLFQGHHKQHIEALAKAVKSLGGTSVAALPAYAFPVETLKTQADVLTFAAGLERGAISAYAGAIPLFDNSDLAKASASILADEAMHWAVLRQALGLEPVPGAFFS